MINIKQEKHFARHLGLHVGDLRNLAKEPDSYCVEMVLLDPAKPHKLRSVLDVRGALRQAQRRIYQNILLPKVAPSESSFGGVRGRHIKMNAACHLESRFAFSCDISDFYPSIHSDRVYHFFAKKQGCSPDVARLLTRLCTFRYHLALGLITSPILADQFLKPIDARIEKMARENGLTYTRFVDDITLSGPFDLRKSSFPNVIKEILETSGFRTSAQKDVYGQIGDPEVLITKIRVNRGHLDVAQNYFAEFCRILLDLNSLGLGGDFNGPYYTRTQMYGRLEFICWVNPGQRRQLNRLYQAVPWKKAEVEATKRRLVASKKVLKPLARIARTESSTDQVGGKTNGTGPILPR